MALLTNPMTADLQSRIQNSSFGSPDYLQGFEGSVPVWQQNQLMQGVSPMNPNQSFGGGGGGVQRQISLGPPNVDSSGGLGSGSLGPFPAVMVETPQGMMDYGAAVRAGYDPTQNFGMPPGTGYQGGNMFQNNYLGYTPGQNNYLGYTPGAGPQFPVINPTIPNIPGFQDYANDLYGQGRGDRGGEGQLGTGGIGANIQRFGGSYYDIQDGTYTPIDPDSNTAKFADFFTKVTDVTSSLSPFSRVAKEFGFQKDQGLDMLNSLNPVEREKFLKEQGLTLSSLGLETVDKTKKMYEEGQKFKKIDKDVDVGWTTNQLANVQLKKKKLADSWAASRKKKQEEAQQGALDQNVKDTIAKAQAEQTTGGWHPGVAQSGSQGDKNQGTSKSKGTDSGKSTGFSRGPGQGKNW